MTSTIREALLHAETSLAYGKTESGRYMEAAGDLALSQVRAALAHLDAIETAHAEVKIENDRVCVAGKWFYVPENQPTDTVSDAEETLRQMCDRADQAYCRSLDKFSSSPCLGWKAKAEAGKLDDAEMEAHGEANNLMGQHVGMYEAINALRPYVDAPVRESIKDDVLSGKNELSKSQKKYCEEAKRLAAWVESPEGQKSLREASEEVRRIIEDLNDLRRIDPELLNKPMTI